MAEAIIAAALQVGGAAIGLSASAIAFAKVIGVALYANHQRRKAARRARDAANAAQTDRQVMIDITPEAPRTIPLGRVRTVEGVRRRWASGTYNEKLTLVISFAGCEIDGFETFYLNDTAVTLDAQGYVLTEPYAKPVKTSASATVTLTAGTGTFTLPATYVAGSASAAVGDPVNSTTLATVTVVGNVATISGADASTAALTYQYTTSTKLMRIRTWTGAAGQNVGAALAAEYPGKITAADKFADSAVAVVDLEYDQDVFTQGVPNISALIRGAKVLDPRTGTTAWSQNPALHAYHIARHAWLWAVPTAEIRTQDIINAANVCDESVAFTLRKPDNSTSSVTLPRYRCGIVIDTTADPRGAMDEVMETMAGRWGWAGGTWRMRCGATATPVFAMTTDWVQRPINADGIPDTSPVVSISNGVPRDEKVNTITGRCTDPDQRYQVLPFPAVRDTALIAAEGGEYTLDVTYEGVNHIAHAQHLAAIAIRSAQAPMRLQVSTGMQGYRCELFDVGTVALPRYGIAGSLAEVVGWSWHPTRGAQLTLAETASAIYTPAELTGRDPAPIVGVPGLGDIEAVTGVTVTSGTTALSDGSLLVRTKVAWTPVTSQAVRTGGRIEVQYVEAQNPLPTEWATWEEPGLADNAIIPGLRAGHTYVFRVRATKPAVGVRGVWSTHVSHRVAAAPTVSWTGILDKPADSELLNLQGSYAVFLAWNFTASAEGWTAGGASLSSGGTSITITSSGTDPQLIGPAMAVSGTVFDRVRARIRRTAGAGWDGTAFYTTASHTWETAYRRTVTTDPTVLGQWRVVEWDMSALTAGGSDWLANTITGLRLDLGSTSADAFEVDWIGIGTVGPASYGAIWGQNVAGSAAVDAAISAAQSAATSAATAASTAQSSANSANAAIADSAADAKLSPVEKQRDAILFNAIVAEKSGIDARADAFGITTEKTAYGSAYSTLYTYALGLLANVTTTSDIDGPTYRGNFGALYAARQVLLNKIAEEAGKRASWATVTGTGKPADFANVAGVGGYVNADPTLIRPEMWTHSNTSGAVAAWANNFGVGEGLWTALDKSAGGRDDIFSESMPVSPLRSYRIEAWIYKWSGSTAAHYLFVEFRDAAGAVVTTSTGWAAVGAYNFWGLAGAAPAAVGSNAYTFTFGRFGTATIPATAVTMRVGILGGYSGSGRWSMGSLRLREYTDQATLTSATWLTAGPGMELIGNTAAKTGGSADWSSAVYSKDSFTGGAYVSCVPAQTTLQFMIGLNADPTTDAGFASIDYALHAKTDGTLDVYSAGVLTAVSIGTYAAGDVLAVAYDGFRFTFVRNGVVLYPITNVAFASVPLYADSSFYSVGARVSGLTFGPMSTVSGIATPQLAANAATIVYEYIASASVTITGLSHVPDGANSSWNTEVGSVSVPAQAVDHDAVVTFIATATMTAGASAGSLRYSVQDDVSWDNWKKQYVSQTAGTSSGERPIQVERRFSVPAGVARTYKAWACKLNSDDTATINYHSLKVEILRR